MTDPRGFASRAIHHGYDPLQNDGALTPPLHLTSTFAFESAEAGGEMFAGERGRACLQPPVKPDHGSAGTAPR